MFKSNLPASCPPTDAQEQSVELYRLLILTDIVESFKNYVELNPDNESYKTICKAYGLSLFDNIIKAQEILSRENNEGKVIAKVQVKPEHGRLVNNNIKTGHYTLWPYENFDPTTINYEVV